MLLFMGCWVTSHQEIQGKGKANKLAKELAKMPLIGPVVVFKRVTENKQSTNERTTDRPLTGRGNWTTAGLLTGHAVMKYHLHKLERTLNFKSAVYVRKI